MTLAENLRSAREEKGLSQAELARRVGVRQTLISQIEVGDVQTTKFIYKIAEELGTQAHKLDPNIPSPTGDKDRDEWNAIFDMFPERRRPSLMEMVRNLVENTKAMLNDE